MTMPEALAAVTVLAIGAGVTLPQLGSTLRARRLDGAARSLSMQMQRARMEAIAQARAVGILFERTPGGGRWRMHADGGLTGILSTEIAAGIDAPIGDPRSLSADSPGVALGLPPTGPIPRIPPSTGVLLPGDDPIAFGGSDIFSASPTGSTSGGTLYLTDGRSLRAVVAYGPTGRIRVWRYDAETGRWRQ